MKILQTAVTTLMTLLAGPLLAQTSGTAVPILPGGQAVIVVVADYHKSMDFYHDFLGLEFAAIPQPRAFRAMPKGIDDLYDVKSDQLRNQLLRVPGSEIGIELDQFDERTDQPARVRLQDPGTTFLSFTVRDIDAMLTRLKNGGAEVVTPSGQPVTLETKERVIFLKDPNGLFLRLVQPDPLPTAQGTANILGMSVVVAIDDTAATMKAYRELFGMDFRMGADFATDKIMEAAGTAAARYRMSTGSLPNSSFNLEFWEFAGIDRKPTTLRSHDPGVPILRLRSPEGDIDAIASSLEKANVRIVSTSRKPIVWMGGTRIIMARDFNNLHWEFLGTNQR